MSWIFSEDDFIKGSPSRKQLTVQQELKTRESIYDFAIRLGLALRLNGKTILAATVYIARFYMRLPITTSKYFVVCAAIAILCKLHDNFRQPDKIALAACQLKTHKPVDEHSDVFWHWRDQLLYREELILRNLNFDLNVRLPYEIRDRLLERPEFSPPPHDDDDAPDTLAAILSDDEREPAPDAAQVAARAFYAAGRDVLKQCVAWIEVVSSLPVLVTYSAESFFGCALVVVAHERTAAALKDAEGAAGAAGAATPASGTAPASSAPASSAATPASGAAPASSAATPLPAGLLELVPTTAESSYQCYCYIRRLLDLGNSPDPHLASHRAAAKRVPLLDRAAFFTIAA